MTDIPKVMLDRAFEAYWAEGVRRDAGRSRVEAALRAALQPLPMESALTNQRILIIARFFDHDPVESIEAEWDEDAGYWRNSITSGLFTDEHTDNIIGWFPIIGGNHD
jgi:phosphoribosyl 1,2-cyclic phosphodiesterase